MINLKQSNINYLKLFLFIIIIFFQSQILSSTENKIIFKINDKAFTTLDYQKRKQYLEFVGNNSSLSKDFIINDFISANLFFEFYTSSKLKFKLKESEVFENIKETNKKNKKELGFNINKEEILYNIKIEQINVVKRNKIN